MGLFVDLIELDERRTNAALEILCKADHGSDASIWDPMDSPFVRRLVEAFTQRGLMRLDAFQQALQEWAAGAHHVEGAPRPPRPDGAVERWTSAEVQLVKLYLEAVAPSDYTLDDWMLMVDYLHQRYMPADDLRAEAEWLAKRAAIMGRVQANVESLTARQADTVLAAVPENPEVFEMSPRQRATLDFARVHAAENVRALSDDARHKMRGVIMRHAEARILRKPGMPATALQTDLVDAFGTLNRDWRRIAVTEAADAQNHGFIASLKPGGRVKRVEQYKGTCSFCTKINGRVMTVVDPAAADKDGETQVWVGKDNVGRSAAPRKRVGSLLVEREPDELWWIPAGTVHPHCRGRWIPMPDAEPGDDPDFAVWLNNLLEKK